ncbi:MAG: AAA family ATPase [Flavobacteriales bacterium]|nr:AAA family ATPase [Flavobacteriales bacterium]
MSALAPLAERILTALGHNATAGQERAAIALDRLLASARPNATLVLKGYAGTGKTTLVGALVRVLAAEKRAVVLLAPTGRAAKVLSAYAQAPASTIHRRIYRGLDDEGQGGLDVAVNRDRDALFVVDEASMIGRGGGDGLFRDGDLLTDLFEHVFSSPGCKLLLIGDPAQLPPVGSTHSPALDVKELAALGLTAGVVELTEVVRQAEASGILSNATELRGLLEPSPRPATLPPPPDRHGGPRIPTFQPHPDVHRITGHDLQDALETAYAREGPDEVCVICRSNKRAYQYSMQVRARIYDHEEELCPGDRLMVVKNNYFWAGRNGKPELIANGEPMEVERVHGIEERFGLRFADITAVWWNGREQRELDVKVMLDVLAIEAPALPAPRLRLLQQAVMDTSPATTKALRFRALRESPHANALQVKYGYAVTCHKAQGGQWNTVFVDQGYVTEEMIDEEYIRWLYTAITRASRELYLLNFHGRFWGEDE